MRGAPVAWPYRAALGALVLLSGALAVVDAGRDSATADEPLHVAGAVALVRHSTWAVNVEQPPLSTVLYGAAAVAAGAREEPPLSYRDLYRTARAQLFAGPAGPPTDRVLLAARLGAVALFLLLLLAAAGAAGSPEAGLLAAALVAGQTALVPHGHLATTDLPAALLVVVTVWAALEAEESPTLVRVLLVAGAGALAVAAKQTALVLLGLCPLLVVLGAWRPLAAPAGEVLAAAGGARRAGGSLRPDRSLPRRLVAALALPVLILAGLLVVLRPVTAGDPPETLPTLVRLLGVGSGDADRVFALDAFDAGLARYALSTLFIYRQTAAGRSSYFLGEVSPEPSPAYHVVAVLVKSPLPWLLLAAAGLVIALRRGASRRARLLLLSAAVFLLSTLGGPRIGVRHAFPAVVLLSLGAGAALAPGLSRRGPGAVLAASLLALSPLAAGRSLGRFGLLARAFRDPPLADSNLDWGQDLLRLGDLLRTRGIAPSELGVAYFGGDLPAYRVPGCADLLEAEGTPLPRYVAVSRQLLLVGPGTVPFAAGRPRAARVLAELRARGATLIGRAGEAIDLYDTAPPGP